jgi:hypothetical protein
MKYEFYKTDIEFKVNGRAIKFSVYHNLPKTRGLSMDDAVTNWVYRTKKYTAKSLCRYIMDKETEFICMTEETYKELTEGGEGCR